MKTNYNYRWVGWILFTMASLANFVVICNLLISIFSAVYDVFAVVKEEEACRTYAALTLDMHQITRVLCPGATEEANQDHKLLIRVRIAPDEAEAQDAEIISQFEPDAYKEPEVNLEELT